MKATLVLLTLSVSTAFTVRPPLSTKTTSTSRLFIDKWVADMIDQELYREQHKAEYERTWMEQNRAAVLKGLAPAAAESLPASATLFDDDDWTNARQRRKDAKLARESPQQYCADRCVATGNCDIYEDFFEFSPEEVMAFCNDCVLADDDEPCDIPEAFFEWDGVKP